MIRSYVSFEDALTPVTVVSEDDSPPPGRGIADELARGLESHGLALSHPVSQWEGYGWEFTVNVDGRHTWFMLQASDKWLLVSDAPRTLIERLRGVTTEDQHQKALATLATVLGSPRFTVKWFTKADFESNNEAAASPNP